MTRTDITMKVSLVASLALTGCLGIHHGRPDGRGPRHINSRVRQDTATPKSWRQIYLGSPPKPVHVGYVKTVIRKGQTEGAHWIYDTDFKLIGRISPQGQTFRIDNRGEEVSLGGFALNHAILRLHDRTKRTEVSLSPMPNPRG